MKPSTSALKHFLLCAAATAVASSSSLLVTGAESQTQDDATYSQQQQQQEEHINIERPLIYDDHSADSSFHHNHDGHQFQQEHRNDLGIHNHHKRNRDGVLVSAPMNMTLANETANSTELHEHLPWRKQTQKGRQLRNQKQQQQQQAPNKHTPCHPDLGVLACKTGQFCHKSPLATYTQDETVDFGWQCVDGYTDAAAYAHSDAQNAAAPDSSHRQLQFPPQGPLYDICTYDKKLKYVYNSTIRYPSAWDRCVCQEYDYQLPEPNSLVYTDVQYCHKINKYYCATYYDKTSETDPSAYDACLCSSYDGKKIPNQPNDFCVELPKRYCMAYYEDNVDGIAKCLCDTFGYNDWCNFEAPEGFVFAAPSQKPTQGPTFPPTREPTRVPTDKPTGKPTLPPTREPTVTPTKKPTQGPTDKATNPPTQGPTMAPETNKPTHKMGMKKKPTTPGPTRNPTKKPIAKPTPFPTPGRIILIPGTTKPTGVPTPGPSTRPSPNPTAKPTANPTAKPTDKPTAKPTSKPSPKLKPAPENNGDNVFEFPKADESDVHNVNNLSKVITALKRQPNIADRPGASLRLPAVTFVPEKDDDDYGIGI